MAAQRGDVQRVGYALWRHVIEVEKLEKGRESGAVGQRADAHLAGVRWWRGVRGWASAWASEWVGERVGE
jgi:hypothetical protein